MTEQEIENTKASFFASIRADPKNNDNRLIFGDWAEEQGLSELAAMLRGGSEKWLREFAESCDIGYGRLMRGAAEYLESQNKEEEWIKYITGGSELEGVFTPEEFWNHYEVMTGENVSESNRGNFFSCAC